VRTAQGRLPKPMSSKSK